MDNRGAVRKGNLRCTSIGSHTPTQNPAPANVAIIDPLSSHSSLDGLDPLSQFVQEELDPLSKMAIDEVKCFIGIENFQEL